MSERSVQADVVKKATLKYKASKLRGTTGASVQGPKTYKDFYLVFRAVSGERKELELFSNERRFAEGGPPKFVVDLTDVVGVHVLNGKRNEFYVEVNDGGMCLFETKSSDESTDWVSCFNAVLFAKGPNGEGILQYDVELQDTDRLSFHGAGILELRDGELILCRRDNRSEVVRWRLSHIRSFKAKKRLLTIYSGSRSSTGVGEFLFKSDRSVEITHAIETVVGAMAKDKQKSTRGGRGGPPQQSRSQIQNGAAVSRHWSSSVVDSIPDFQPPVVYEDIPEGDNFGTGAAGYGRLDFNQTSGGRSPRSPTHLPSPEHEGGPGRSARHTSPTHRANNPSFRAAAPPPPRKGRRDYEDLDLGEDEEEPKPNGSKIVRPDHYSLLDRENSPGRRTSPPRGKPHLPSSARPSGPPLPSRPHVPPAPPSPEDEPVDVPDGLYAAVNKPKRRPAATVHGTRPLPPVKPSLSGSNPELSKISTEEYGRLDHKLPLPVPGPEVEYNSLEHVCPKTNGIAGSEKEEYGKLDRKGRQVGVAHIATPPHIAEQYGKLELAQTSTAAVPLSSHYEMEDPQQAMRSLPAPPEEYGRLQHAKSGDSGVPQVQPEEYGRLERPAVKPNGPPSTDTDYSHLEPRPRSSSFNPYGTLSAAELEATTNGVEQESQLTPPQGYEKTEIKALSPAFRASIVGTQLVSKPQAPPRGLSPSPSQQRRAHSYVNVNEKGQVKKGSPPLPMAKPHIADSAAAAQGSSRITSHNAALKSHDTTSNAAASSVRRKPVTTCVSSDYEETEVLDFGIKLNTATPPQKTPPSIPSPQPTRRGPSVRNGLPGSNVSAESSNKPSIAPKPSKVKTKAMVH